MAVNPGQKFQCSISQTSEIHVSYFNIIIVDWPQQALVSSAKIHVSYVECEHNCASEQPARHSKANLELVRKI